MSMIPTKEDVQKKILKLLYSENKINNSHRGDVVEAMVLLSLSKEWKHVGLGWYPWDIEKLVNDKRIRLQVKQCATYQVWGKTKKMEVHFDWKENAPRYFERDNPDVFIEDCGYFCDIFVIGLHLIEDENKVDQMNPEQWQFFVIPVGEIPQKANSMSLKKALDKWTPIPYNNLADVIKKVIGQIT